MNEIYASIINDLNEIDESNDKKEKEYTKRIELKLKKSELLVSEYKELNAIGNFRDNTWIFKNELTTTYHIFDFNKDMEELKFKGLTRKDINRLKLYLAHLLVDQELKPSSLPSLYKDIKDFLKWTDCMNEDHISNLVNIIKEKNELKDKKRISRDMYNYLDFLIKELNVSDDNILEYHKKLELIKDRGRVEKNSRKLPTSENIALFHHTINKFFNDDGVPNELKLLYTPVQIWWKLSNIIPLRPSEITVNLVRDCIYNNDDGDYYIKIKRVKDASASNFPIKTEFLISDEIAKLIKYYIDKTNEYGETDTLFSYYATVELRDRCNKLGHELFNYGVSGKNDPLKFTSGILEGLIDSFYEVVMKGIYELDIPESKINPGDTRHFAFFSLLMQGVPPLEIALLGGHTTLEMQINYQNGVEYYIGTELYKFLENKGNSNKKKISKLKDIINSKPIKCPKPIEERRPLKIGYCLCDFNTEFCDNVDDFCCFCSKWWGEPIRATYDKWVKEISKSMQELEEDNFFKLTALEEFLNRMYSSKYLQDNGFEAYVDMDTTINKIKSNCDNIVGMKMALIADDYINKIKGNEKVIVND